MHHHMNNITPPQHHHNWTTNGQHNQITKGVARRQAMATWGSRCDTSQAPDMFLFFFSFFFIPLMIYLLTGRLHVHQHQHQNLAPINTYRNEGPKQRNHCLGPRFFFKKYYFNYFLLDLKTTTPMLKSPRPANHRGKRPKRRFIVIWAILVQAATSHKLNTTPQ